MPDWIWWLWSVADVVIMEERWHFVLGSLAGLLAYLLTWITLYAPSRLVSRLTRRPIPTVAVYGIRFCCLLLAVSLALISHWALDYLQLWYTTPLGPPLELILPF